MSDITGVLVCSGPWCGIQVVYFNKVLLALKITNDTRQPLKEA